MAMSRRARSPYAVLWWLGGALLVLLVGVLAYARLRPSPVVDPERVLLWLYDGADRAGPAMAAVLEESPGRRSLHVVLFPAPDAARQGFAAAGAGQAEALISTALQRRLHRRLFLPYEVLARLIDAAGGVRLGGHPLAGAEAVAIIDPQSPNFADRALQVLLALFDAGADHGLSIGAGEGLRLAQQVDTDLDLLSLPQHIERWRSYGWPPPVQSPPSGDLTAARAFLLPDRP